MCDTLRNSTLVELGVRLEDGASGTVWKRDDPEVLKREIRDKRRNDAEAALKKRNIALVAKEGERDKLAAVAASTLVQKFSDRYRFGPDEQPTHALDPDGSWQVCICWIL